MEFWDIFVLEGKSLYFFLFHCRKIHALQTSLFLFPNLLAAQTIHINRGRPVRDTFAARIVLLESKRCVFIGGDLKVFRECHALKTAKLRKIRQHLKLSYAFFAEALPLVLLDKYTYQNNETLKADVLVANYGKNEIRGILKCTLCGGGLTLFADHCALLP